MFILYVLDADGGAVGDVEGAGDGDGVGEAVAEGAAEDEGAAGDDVDMAVGAAAEGDDCSFPLPPQADKATASTPAAYQPLAILGMCMTSFLLS
ncbi:hypothetical protein [Cohnella rhizosphaerae]|uniref:hypothetical protein n=1 Tax=Cohnella rhizosphaerae TaxID=1457232 RepID=UPI0030B88697